MSLENMNLVSKLERIFAADQDYQKLSPQQQKQVVDYFSSQQLNILVVGATGAGKSSTINALFDTHSAEVGLGADPMTMDVKHFNLGNLVLWDTPGLGDGVDKDEQHKQKIIHQLRKKSGDGDYLIDLVLVILDGSSRDMGTSFDLINNTIIPNLGNNPEKRILVAINQADIAYKGSNGWDYTLNMPTEVGYRFLDEKVANVKQRIFESANVIVEPIYYCAGYQDPQSGQNPFNLSKLLYMLVQQAPQDKRMALRTNLSMKKESWTSSDGRKDYNKENRESFGLGKLIGSVIGFLFGVF